ncbi:hypothetical protein FF2_022857 [Malus domestica]
MVFKTMKLLTLLVFFTQVNEKNQNPSWKAIGYTGLDPIFGVPAFVHHSLTIRCDAVVIGTGLGGGVVAGVLTKAGYKVVVLEKGHYHTRHNLTLLEGPTMDQMYLSGGLIATDDTKLYQLALDVVCERMGVQSEIQEEGFNNAVLRKRCQELRYPMENIPRNSTLGHYCGWCCLGCKDGRKRGVTEMWFVDLVNSGNGAIFSGCEAVKALHKRNKGRGRRNTATGVAFKFEHEGGRNIGFVESKVTIVACGALSTPKLLKQSELKNGKDTKRRMSMFSRTAHVFALVRDKGSGTVNAPPNSVSYQMEAIDEHNLNTGLEKSLRILAAAGVEEIGTHHFKG